MDDLWLDESEQVPVVDTFGITKPTQPSASDPFGSSLGDDPFGSSSGYDPFAVQSGSSQIDPLNWLDDKRETELRQRAKADAETRRKKEERRQTGQGRSTRI